MPELPEITFMVNKLKNIKGETLKTIIIGNKSKYIKKKPNNFGKFINLLPLKIKNIFNIGKRIFILFENDWFFILNMGMSGILSYDIDKHNVFEFILSNKTFYFNDQRRFGTLRIFNNNLNKYIKEMGYDPLYHGINFEEFYKKYIIKRKSKLTLAEKLLDQKIFAGLGNYLRAEILYDTQIDPFCIFNNLKKNHWKLIYNSYNKLVKLYTNNKKSNKYLYEFKIYNRVDKKETKKKKIKGRMLWYSEDRIKYKCN